MFDMAETIEFDVTIVCDAMNQILIDHNGDKVWLHKKNVQWDKDGPDRQTIKVDSKVAFWKISFSKMPGGPFATLVFELTIASLNKAIVFEPMSPVGMFNLPTSSSGISSRAPSFSMAKSTGRITLSPCCSKNPATRSATSSI